MVDDNLNSFIRQNLRPTRYQGGMGEISRITIGRGPINQVLVVGTGRFSALERKDFWKLGLSIGKQLDALGVTEASIALGDVENDKTASAATALIEGVHMAMYRFDQFKSEQKDHHKPRFESLSILTNTHAARLIQNQLPALKALLEATNTTRDAANLPPNIANPEYMANQARKLEKLGVKVQVIEPAEMKKLGMNLILAVGASAAEKDQPRLILMTYNGGKKGEKPVAIVGKGVMYDTGGYNIKPGKSMSGMKFDMSGAAAVLGTMQAIASRKSKVNVVGVMTCAMNMIGIEPFVPDSVYKSYKGLFVEIGNTDAEGRLVLADAIAYTIEKHEPTQLVDLATLTGACMVALGGGYAGLFSTSQPLANALRKSGDEMGELLWPLPVDDYFTAKSEVADINNDGAPYGGASVGACFIKKFVDKTPWAHLDIAGVANSEKIPGGQLAMNGATGFGVRLLTNWLENLAEPEDGTVRKRRGRPPLAQAKAAKPKAAKGKRGRPRKSA